MTNQPDKDKDEEAAGKYVKFEWGEDASGFYSDDEIRDSEKEAFLAGCKYKGERILEEAFQRVERTVYGDPMYISYEKLKKIINGEPTPPQPEGEANEK